MRELSRSTKAEHRKWEIQDIEEAVQSRKVHKAHLTMEQIEDMFTHQGIRENTLESDRRRTTILYADESSARTTKSEQREVNDSQRNTTKGTHHAEGICTNDPGSKAYLERSMAYV